MSPILSLNRSAGRPALLASAAVLLMLSSPLPRLAEAEAQQPAAKCARGDQTAEAATPPAPAAADGTAPGNAGSTGWTGGTGGAYIGTNPQGAISTSPNWQPPTARGLDLAMAAEEPNPQTGC